MFDAFKVDRVDMEIYIVHMRMEHICCVGDHTSKQPVVRPHSLEGQTSRKYSFATT